MPVGFKWFVDGLLDGSLGFGGEESAGASFLRIDGTTWTTDKDGIILGLLAAEITATLGVDPGARYASSPASSARRCTSASTRRRRSSRSGCSAQLSPEPGRRDGAGRRTDPRDPDDRARQRRIDRRAEGDHRQRMVRRAPVRHEDVYKIYAESFRDRAHLERIQAEAQALVARLFT